MWLRFIPYALAAIAGAAGLWGLYNEGYQAGQLEAATRCAESMAAVELEHDKALQQAEQGQEQREADAVKRARAYWEANQEREVVTRTVEKEVIKYVQIESDNLNACELDADFLRIWNAANAGSFKNESGSR